MNTKNSILLVDPNYQSENSKQYGLIIRLGINSFSYAIIDGKSNSVLALYDEQECADATRQFVQHLVVDSKLNHQFDFVKFACFSENTVIIPKELTFEDPILAHKNYFPKHNQEDLQLFDFERADHYIIYSIPAEIKKIIEKLAAKVAYLPSCAGIFCSHKPIRPQVLSLDFAASSFNIIFFTANHLIFQQSFEIDNVDELNYYLLLLLDQLRIDFDNTEVVLSGIIHEGDDRHALLKSYFVEAKMLELDYDLEKGILEDMPKSYFLSLLAIQECE